MSMHRAIPAAAVLFFAAGSALAQLATESSLFAATVSQDTAVPVKGLVTGSPESVNFTGNAVVKSRLAPDPDFNRPRLVLTIDLRPVSGLGSMSGAKYVISGPELTQREVAASHTLEFTFPFKSTRASSAETARTGVASFVLDFDPSTGAVTRAKASVSSPNFAR